MTVTAKAVSRHEHVAVLLVQVLNRGHPTATTAGIVQRRAASVSSSGRHQPAAASSSQPAAGETSDGASCSSSLRPDDPSKGPPVLVVPAFYLDAQSFKPFVQELRSRGFNAALPPIR